jgi:hypothetical protein
MIRANYKIPRGMGRGLIQRDMSKAPLGSSAPMFSRPLTPRSEWGDRIAEKKKHRAMLSDIRNISGPNGGMVPALNQGRDPWCWAFSPTSAATLARASAGSPYKHLSGNAVGNMVTGFKVRGGWSENSMKFIQKNGVPETSYWPEGDNKRHWDSPDTWANAAENVVLEWWDIDPGDTAAIMTCLLLNYPVAVDIPAWGHSVCLIDPVDAAGKEFDQLNSWGNNWNGNGIGRLKGKYTKFSSAIACTVVTGG